MKAKPQGQRQLRVGELVRHALADIIARGELADETIDRLGVTVLEVQLSPDLRLATLYVRPLLPGNEPDLLAALERHQRQIRKLLAPRLNLRYMPEIRFRLDTSLDYAAHVDEILNRPEVRRDLAAREDSEGEEN